MEDHFECIAVANTFSQRWEMIDYYQLAFDYGYRITAITVNTGLSDEELAKRNRHGVPIETIRAMRERWEA
jgi:predicted kinase